MNVPFKLITETRTFMIKDTGQSKVLDKVIKRNFPIEGSIQTS